MPGAAPRRVAPGHGLVLRWPNMAGTLSSLTRRFPITARQGDSDPHITSLSYDSRTVEDGSLFFALPGVHVDGHAYITDAVERGARAVVCEMMPEDYAKNVVYLQVHDARQALSALSARFFDSPSRRLPVIGVTGTDGKTTTVFLINQLLEALGEESGFISTALIKRDLRLEKNPFRQSTPEAPEIHGFLSDMIDAGKRFAVVEATSHGLSEKTARLRDLFFHAAVFTNLSHEHLEFHGTMEQYRSDKANLFRSLDRTAQLGGEREWPIFGVVNLDDPNAYYFRNATRRPVLTYSLQDTKADLYVSEIEPGITSTSCVINWRRESRRFEIPLAGHFNVQNVLAALLTVSRLLDHNPLDLQEAVAGLRGVPGRMNVVDGSLPFAPIVDYAHTPGAFERVLPMVKQITPGRLIVVFGSAGERDRDKRPMQGRLAARFADIVVLADEDPRGEEPQSILEEIAAGCLEERPMLTHGVDLWLIPPRREAIAHALSLAHEGDTVLCLGKGHESSIIYADRIEAWDEIAVVKELLRERTAAQGATK